MLALSQIDLSEDAALGGSQDNLVPEPHQFDHVAVSLKLGGYVNASCARNLDLSGRHDMFYIDCLFSPFTFGNIEERLFVHHDNPLRWFNSILILQRILVLFFGHLWKIKEIDCIDIQFSDQVRVKCLLGSHCKTRECLFCKKDHFVGISNDSLIFNVLPSLVLYFCPFHDLHNPSELF